MSLTVSSLAKEYYNVYALTKSDTFAQNQVDASVVSQEAYDISDLDTAFETLTNASQKDFESLGSVSGYAKSIFQLSQSSVFSKMDESGSILEDLLDGGSDAASIYDAISEQTESMASSVSDVINAYSDSTSAYRTYLNENVLDTDV